jgi:hypothetical protein
MPTRDVLTAAAVPRAARRVRQEWAGLCAPTAHPPPFDAATIADLPEPVRRYLTHAIAPGTPLWTSVQVAMVGQIRLGPWRRFSADQVVAPDRGYIWAAVTRLLGVPLVGYDRLGPDGAEMRWRLLDVLPLVDASGPDVARSAAGRLASEIVLVPTAFRSATWAAGGPDTAVATVGVGPEQEQVELHLDPDGRVLDLVLQRWGDPGGEPFGRHTFGVTVDAERTQSGITTPAVVRAGWWRGTDREDSGEFFRAEYTLAEFR